MAADARRGSEGGWVAVEIGEAEDVAEGLGRDRVDRCWLVVWHRGEGGSGARRERERGSGDFGRARHDEVAREGRDVSVCAEVDDGL